MKKINIIVIFLILGIAQGYAQNLVPNPSFELYDTCPFSGGQISFAPPWKGVTTNSTDYFNGCSFTWTGVPRCGAGWQYARTGSAYALLYAINGYGSNYREYLRVKLDSVLESDSCYFVEFYCNVYNLSRYGVNRLGAHISTSMVNAVGPGLVLQNIPQVVSGAFLNDTLNWMRISEIYHATGGEKYITIGNFSADADTDTIHIGGSNYNGSYYLIDDVSVTKIAGCDSTLTSVVEKSNTPAFNIFPNPNTGTMTLEYHISMTEGLVEIKDITGKTVARYTLPANADKLTITNDQLQNGIYIYHVSVNGKVVKSDKLLIIK